MNESRSLRGALHDSANRAAAGAGPLATERVITLGRRRRRARQAGTAVVALSAVTAVVLAGTAVADLRMHRTADESASQPGYTLCGTTSDDLGWEDTAPDRELEVTTVGPRVDEWGFLTVTTDLADTSQPIAGAAAGPSFVVLDRTGGVVVGVLDDTDPEARVDVPASSSATVTTTGRLLSCATQDGSTTLEPGTYTLLGSRTVFAGTPEREGLAVSSWDLAVGTGTAAADLEGPTCDAPVPEGLSSDDLVVASQTPPSGTSGTYTGAAHAVTNGGPTTVGLGTPRMMLVLDGRVVALSDGPFGVDTPTALHPGETLAQDALLSLTRCTSDGGTSADALAPGDYEAWTWTPVDADGSTSGRLTGPTPFAVAASFGRTGAPVCGASTEDLAVASGERSTILTLTAQVEAAPRRTGVVTVTNWLGGAGDLTIHVLREDDSIILVRDGMVVAIHGIGDGDRGRAGSSGAIGGWGATGRGTSGTAWQVSPESCSTGEPLAAGDYEAWPVTWVTALGIEDPDGALRPGSTPGWLVGQPTMVTLAAPAG